MTITSTFESSANYWGPGSLNIASSGSWAIDGGSISGGQVNVVGTSTLSSGSSLVIQPGAVLTNVGTLTLLGNSSLLGSSSFCSFLATEFINDGGIIIDPRGSGSSYFGGCLDAQNAGSITIASGTLDVGGASLNLNPGSSINGNGILQVDNSGYLVINTPLTIQSLNNYATVIAQSPLAVSSALDSSGAFVGPSPVTVSSSAVWTAEGGSIRGGLVVNDGSAELGANAQLGIASGSSLINQGTITLDASSTIDGGDQSCYLATEFINEGTLDVNATSTGSASIGQTLDTSYCMVASNTGTIDIVSGTLNIGNQILYLEQGASVVGPGTLTVGTEGQLGVETPIAIPNLDNYSQVLIDQPLEVTSSLDSTGTFSGLDALTIDSGAIWTVEGGNITSGQIVNDGDAELGSNSTFTIQPGAVVTNNGTFVIDAYGSIASTPYFCSESPEFVNSGTVDSRATTTGTNSLTSSCLNALNLGSIEIESGVLAVNSGSVTFGTGTAISGNGTLSLNSGAALVALQSVSIPTLDLNGGLLELAASANVSVGSLPSPTGSVQLDGAEGFGEIVVAGPVSVSSLSLSFSGSFAPVCGSSVTALTAASVSGLFSSVNGSDLVSPVTWQPESTSTTAGAGVSCS